MSCLRIQLSFKSPENNVRSLVRSKPWVILFKQELDNTCCSIAFAGQLELGQCTVMQQSSTQFKSAGLLVTCKVAVVRTTMKTSKEQHVALITAVAASLLRCAVNTFSTAYIDSQLREKKKSCRKSCTSTGCRQKPKLCGIKKSNGIQRQSCVRGPTFPKSCRRLREIRQRRKHLPSNVASFRNWEGAEDPAHQEGRRAHNKCIAPGQQKRSVGHALFVCGDVGNISTRTRPQRESAKVQRQFD